MRSGGSPGDWKVIPLAQETSTVFASPDPAEVNLGQPAIAVLPAGRIVAAFDLYGPGVRKLPGGKGKLSRLNRWLQGRIFTSNDKGQTWTFRHDYPFCDTCLFRDGSTLYLIGHADTVQVIKSSDGGETWSKPGDLTGEAEVYTQAPANVLAANGHFHLVLMRLMDVKSRGEATAALAPVVLKAPQGSNLAVRKNWTFSEPSAAFRNLVPTDGLDYFGVPFFPVPEPPGSADVGNKRWAYRIGWGEAHVLQIRDPKHYWHDPSGRTLHILARAAAHRSNLAVLARAAEGPDGRIVVGLEKTPAGTRAAFLPLPGGHARFSVVHDESSGLYWLAGNQATDSMTRAERLPPERYRLPCDEFHRLQLQFSKNLVDWHFAGYVSAGARPAEARLSPSMAIRGADLCIACCAGDAHSRHGHDTNRVTFHLIPGFRELVY